jgi:hypothetical protein
MTGIFSAASCSHGAKNARRASERRAKRNENFSNEKEGQQMLRLAEEFVSAALLRR